MLFWSKIDTTFRNKRHIWEKIEALGFLDKPKKPNRESTRVTNYILLSTEIPTATLDFYVVYQQQMHLTNNSKTKAN